MYNPRRTARFEYLWEVMNFVEENQCRMCVHSKLKDPDENKSHAEEYPMCYEVEGAMMLEEPVHEFDEDEHGLITCNKFERV